MQYWGFFERYNPVLSEDDIRAKLNVLFLKNEKGEDWYDVAKRIPLDEIVVVADSTGSISISSREADRLFPQEGHVYSFHYDGDPSTLVGRVIRDGRIVEATVRRAVTRYEARMFLLNNGLLERVEEFVRSDPALCIWYEDAPMWDVTDSQVKEVERFLSAYGQKLEALFAEK